MSQKPAIQLQSVEKMHRLFARPLDRLKEALSPFGKTYHQVFWALRDVNLAVLRGESLGILGRNGSGKSTLVQIIAGVRQPTAGQVSVNGRVAALLELGAGFNPEFTGRSNVVLYGTLAGYSPAEMRERLPDIERFASIGEFFDQPMKTYSSGMLLRVAFAAAIHVNPDIILIDEVLAVGDVRFIVRCVDRIKELRRRGTTILLVTHAPDLVVQLCDRAIVLDGGRMVFDGNPRAAADAYHRLMFTESRPAPTIPAARGLRASSVPAFAAFVESEHDDDRCVTRASYNPEEQRLDSGKAAIIDYLIHTEHERDPVRVPSGAILDIFVRVRKLVPFAAPVIGLNVWTVGGVHAYGTNSELEANAFEVIDRPNHVTARVRLHNTLQGGHYFLDVGITVRHGDSYEVLQMRRRMIHIVAGETPWFSGVTDLGVARIASSRNDASAMGESPDTLDAGQTSSQAYLPDGSESGRFG